MIDHESIITSKHTYRQLFASYILAVKQIRDSPMLWDDGTSDHDKDHQRYADYAYDLLPDILKSALKVHYGMRRPLSDREKRFAAICLKLELSYIAKRLHATWGRGLDSRRSDTGETFNDFCKIYNKRRLMI